jgi:hypothetical protein
MNIEKIEIEFSDTKIIEIEITFVYRNITSNHAVSCRSNGETWSHRTEEETRGIIQYSDDRRKLSNRS